ncbi:MAG TPA: translocation/assembly module TamB domain-containing protein, partial [Blastocatellia bacterium]|nr:translocation/assembly module TamB domain-containing protein [Blastocatellia bacterium]
RKLLIGAIIFLSLVLLLAVSVTFYVRSGRLDLYLQEQVIEAFADAGIRAELGKTSLDLRGYRVTLEDIKLYAGDGEKPFGAIKSLSAQFSVVSYLRQRFQITQVEVTHPQFWLEFDEQGRFNLASLHAPPSKEEVKEKTIVFLTSNFEVKEGEVTFVDREHDISAHVADVVAHLVPLKPDSIEDKLNHRLEFGFTGATATVDGREIKDITANIQANVTDHDAEILAVNEDPQFKITSDLGWIKVNGKVESFDPFKYRFTSVQAEGDLAQVARVFTPRTPMNGKLAFAGNIQGTGRDYRASGSLDSQAVTVAGFNVSGIRINTDVNGSDGDYKGKANVKSSGVSGKGLTIGSIALADVTVKGKELDFDVTGALALASLKSGAINVGGIRGQISADPKIVSISQLGAQALGGAVTGSASLAFSGGSSQVDVHFKSVDLAQAATLASAKDVEVRGVASGTAKLSFPGFNFKAATGRVEAAFDASVSPSTPEHEVVPATGEVAITASAGAFRLERAIIHSQHSELIASGPITRDGAASLDVSFRSDDMSEVWRTIDAFGVIPNDVKEQYEIALTGAGEFKGRLEGTLSEPKVDGHLKLAGIELNSKEAGAFEGDISYSPSLLSINNGSLARSDGSRADFTINAPLGAEVKDNMTVKANVQGFDLSTIVRAIEPKLSDFIGQGAISGTIDLKGLPGPRTIEGSAKVSITAGEFILPSSEEGKDTEKTSVPELSGDVTIANSELVVQNLRMRIGDKTAISGQGRFNLDTYAYSVNAEGKNIDLAVVSERLSDMMNVSLTGTADLVVSGQGKWGNSDDWSEANLNATIEGHSVGIGGRDVGDAKLTAVTENGVVKLRATGVLLNEPRSLEATIDLRDRKNYPINASIEFTDADIGPYLGLVAPELSGIEGKASGTIKLTGPLQDTDKIQAIADLSKLEVGGAISNGQRYTIKNQENVVLTATPKEIILSKVTFTGEATSITLGGSISREASPSSNLTIDGALNLRFLNSFTDVVFATGVARLHASIVGTLESPQLLGLVNLEDVGVRVVNFPLVAAHGNGQIRFTSNQALVENFLAATPGGGKLSVRGGAALSAGLLPDRWRLEIDADEVAAEYPRDTQTVVDASLTLQGNRKLQVLSGNIEVRRASYTRDLTLEELITTGGPFTPDFLDAGPGGRGETSALQTTLDLRITADNTLLIKNNLADAVGSAFLNIRGSLDQPVASGRILLTRGTLEFRNGRYDLTRGLITIPARRGAEPTVDLQAEADIRGYHIITAFNGAPSKLQTTVRSEPELPEADIVSLILTGTVSGDRSTIAASSQNGLGLAQSILSASLSEQLERGTQRLFGLSRFSIDPLLVGRSNDPTARITIGQRITKDLTVTYSQNLTSGVSGIERVVLVEYRISNRLSVVGFRNESDEIGFDVRLRRKF